MLHRSCGRAARGGPSGGFRERARYDRANPAVRRIARMARSTLTTARQRRRRSLRGSESGVRGRSALPEFTECGSPRTPSAGPPATRLAPLPADTVAQALACTRPAPWDRQAKRRAGGSQAGRPPSAERRLLRRRHRASGRTDLELRPGPGARLPRSARTRGGAAPATGCRTGRRCGRCSASGGTRRQRQRQGQDNGSSSGTPWWLSPWRNGWTKAGLPRNRSGSGRLGPVPRALRRDRSCGRACRSSNSACPPTRTWTPTGRRLRSSGTAGRARARWCSRPCRRARDRDRRVQPVRACQQTSSQGRRQRLTVRHTHAMRVQVRHEPVEQGHLVRRR